MSAGAMLFLYLLPLASLPVVFHLLMQRKRKKLVFSTLMFFHRVDPRLSSRRRLREILLLASRVLLLALLLLMLARLTLHASGGLLGLHGKQAAVVVIDNSASMNSPASAGPVAGKGEGSPRDQTKLHLAIESVRALLANLDENAEAGIVLCVNDPHAGLDNAGMSADHGALVKVLDRVQPTDAAGNPPRALARAFALLRSTHAGGGAVHVFTDLQESEWAQQKIDDANVPDDVQVVFHRIASPAAGGANVAIAQAELIGRRILPRQPYSIQIVLRNDSDGAVKVRLNSEDDQRKTHTEEVSIDGAKEKTVTLLVQPESPGYHWVKVWIEGDGFAGDNRAVVGYLCESKATVILTGTAANYGILPFALSPFGDGRYTSLVLSYCQAEELRARVEQAQEKPALVVTTWSDLSKLGQCPWLHDFVTQGGNLAILPAADSQAAADNGPAWLGAGIAVRAAPAKELPLEIMDKTSPFWAGLRDPEGRLRLGQASVRSYAPVTLAGDKGYVNLLGVGLPASPVLATTRMGKGQVVVSGLAFDLQWSTLPRLKSVVVLAQTIALGGRVQETSGLAIAAGTALDSLPGQGDQVHIVSLLGDPLDWTGPRGQLPGFPRSGAYSIQAGTDSFCLSVRASDREGSPRYIEGTIVPAMGRTPHTVRNLNETDLQQALAASRTGLPLYLPFLLLAMVALMAESLLGAPPRRKADRDELR